MKKKAAAYVRVSTVEQKDEGNSIEAQKSIITQYANIDGYSAEDIVFFVESVSGRQLSKRTEMLRLMEEVSKGNFSSMYVYELPRLGRNMSDGLHILKHLEKNEVTFVSCRERIDTTTSFGKMFVQQILSWAEFYSNNLGERVKQQVDFNKENGRRYSRPILGFSQDNPEKKLVVIDSESKVVQLIFKMRYKNKKSMREISEILNECGLKGKNGGKFRQGTIKKVLEKETLYKQEGVIN